MIHSEFMNEEYEHEVINFKKNIKERSETLQEEKARMSKVAIVTDSNSGITQSEAKE